MLTIRRYPARRRPRPWRGGRRREQLRACRRRLSSSPTADVVFGDQQDVRRGPRLAVPERQPGRWRGPPRPAPRGRRCGRTDTRAHRPASRDGSVPSVACASRPSGRAAERAARGLSSRRCSLDRCAGSGPPREVQVAPAPAAQVRDAPAPEPDVVPEAMPASSRPFGAVQGLDLDVAAERGLRHGHRHRDQVRTAALEHRVRVHVEGRTGLRAARRAALVPPPGL